jgi:hypothetical protein
VWLSKDASEWSREWITILGEEFGTVGPAVIDWLKCQAKLQNAAGFVKTGVRTVARGIFCEDVVTVGHVLSRAVEIGQLEEYVDDRGRFTCRISGWRSDQERAQAAARKAKQRAGNTSDDRELSRSVTPSPTESQKVTLTVQDSKEEPNGSSSDKNAHGETAQPTLPAPIARHGRIVFELLAAYAAEHPKCNAVSKTSLARVIASRPNRPIVRACHDYLAYQDRAPKARQHKDLVQGYEWQLENRYTDLAAVEELDTAGLPFNVDSGTAVRPRPLGGRSGTSAQHAGGRVIAPNCPVPAGTDPHADEAWARTEAALPDSQFAVWIDGLHAHALQADGTLIIGGDPERIAWINDRSQYLQLLETAAGCPVTLTACARDTRVAA